VHGGPTSSAVEAMRHDDVRGVGNVGAGARRSWACRQGRWGRSGPRVGVWPRVPFSPTWLPRDLDIRALGQQRGKPCADRCNAREGQSAAPTRKAPFQFHQPCFPRLKLENFEYKLKISKYESCR
jgi:hypothetical protein